MKGWWMALCFLGRSIYNHQPIRSRRCWSTEHIIPKRLFVNASHASHPLNLVPCDRFTNKMRVDLRLGDPETYSHVWNVSYPNNNITFVPESLVSLVDDPKCFLVIDGNGIPSGVIDRIQRVFYPCQNTDMKLVCQCIVAMLFLYPYLYACLDQMVEHPSLLQKYS